jgi:hypothetical protein
VNGSRAYVQRPLALQISVQRSATLTLVFISFALFVRVNIGETNFTSVLDSWESTVLLVYVGLGTPSPGLNEVQ